MSNTDRIHELADQGKSDVLIARELGLTLAQVMRARSGAPADAAPVRQVQRTTQHISTPEGSMTVRATGTVRPVPQAAPINPKEMIERLMRDIDECVVLALSEYRADPSSETGYNALTSLTTTLKELIKSREALNDPKEIAESIVLQILRPMIYSMLKSTITNFDRINKELSLTFSSETQRERFKEAIEEMLVSLTAQVKTDYNRGVSTLEEVYGVELDRLYLKKADDVA